MRDTSHHPWKPRRLHSSVTARCGSAEGPDWCCSRSRPSTLEPTAAVLGLVEESLGKPRSGTRPDSPGPPERKLKVVVCGGHPGDPEYGCGGTIARYSDLGHEVVLREIVETERPDILFTHWPIDNHADHRAISMLAYDAWLHMGKKFAFY